MNISPKKGAKIVVAMSGGVDSSVTAAWLKRQGYYVIGISLQLHDMAEDIDNKFGTCCSLTDIQDARQVAAKMDIPFYVSDREELFKDSVIDDFVQEYLKGRTPNPCVRCNEKVKFSNLMDWALDLGADYLATGHYATIRKSREEFALCKGRQPEKDQSYFLFTLNQKDLARSLFPVGDLTKAQVRELATDMGLGVAQKPDSQEICFVKESYKAFIEKKVDPSMLKPGFIVDEAGNHLGEHGGIHQFTIGQRKGIGIASEQPLYVINLLADKNEVVIGPDEKLFHSSCVVSNVNWIAQPLLPATFDAKIRYRSKESPARVIALAENQVRVEFEEPQRAITPGQVAVFYEEDRVMGGGWIESL